LYLGHSTAAVSTVVAAFMGGLATGAALGGRVADRFTRRQALYGYALLEGVVILTALAIPFVLAALAPTVLPWAYRDGEPGWLFPLARVALGFSALFLPAMALGATFPFGVRWFVPDPGHAGLAGGALYAANTVGAGAGAISAGFLLIPSIGVSGATFTGVAAGGAAIALALLAGGRPSASEGEPAAEKVVKKKKGSRELSSARQTEQPAPRWLGSAMLAVSGAATFLLEIAWARVFATVMGPSTYAFAATLTGMIGGLAIGSAVGAAIAGRTRRPELPLVIALGGAALAAAWLTSFAGSGFPLMLIEEVARNSEPFGELVIRNAARVAMLVAPVAVGLGVAYPLSLALAAAGKDKVARSLGTAYAINTLASVVGSLGAGFVAIPLLGLENTLRTGSGLLLAGAATAAVAGRLSTTARVMATLPAAAALVVMIAAGSWDRELLASGGYKYAARVPKDVDLRTALKAGRLLHYQEGTTGIVSVKLLTGDRSLAIDGKVDASTSGDMLTQKVLAHLPLLLHEDPHTVCIIGLGSGITLASALTHPVNSVDVVEISPEVVAASRFFAEENRNALNDARTRLVVGDGRSHLAWSRRHYDIIVSEPSNPWMAGVAALFTREFFTAVRDRLAPDGIFCQWAHTYDISDADLRSIVETFRSVFPDGTMWLVGDGDLLLVGAAGPLDTRLANVERNWLRPGVAADLAGPFLLEPFGLLSLFSGGSAELEAYAAGAPEQTDDRMALEFTGPGALNSQIWSDNAAKLKRLLEGRPRPPAIARAMSDATAAAWRGRAAMMLQAGSYDESYVNYVTALERDPSNTETLTGLVRAAIAARREADALAVLRKAASSPQAVAPRVALSRLLAATGAYDDAVRAAREAIAAAPADRDAYDQLASLFADAGDAALLDTTVASLSALAPDGARAAYYAAAAQFLRGRVPEALPLIRRAIELDGTRAASYNLLGALHASQGDRPEARRAFEQALRLDQRDVTAYNNLGLLELNSGNKDAAADLFAEALTLDPASAMARQGLAQSR
jgi:spermidine synthase